MEDYRIPRGLQNEVSELKSQWEDHVAGGKTTCRRMQCPCSVYEIGSHCHKIDLEEQNWEGHGPNTGRSAMGGRRGRWERDVLDFAPILRATDVPLEQAALVAVCSHLFDICFSLSIASETINSVPGYNCNRYKYTVCPESKCTDFLFKYRTYLKLQVISFKVWPLGRYTAVPTFLPLFIAVLEVIFRKCV